MTSSSLQTQCPKCETRFRVTSEQLGIAKGKVRCGNCLSVFNAIEHQVMPRSSSKPAPAQPEPETSEDYRTPEEDFVFADNPEEDASEEPYAGTKLTFSDDELSDSFRTMDGQNSSDFQDAGDDDTAKDVDESWAEAILNETAKPASKTVPEPEPPEEAQTAKPEPDYSDDTVESSVDSTFDPDMTSHFELKVEAEPVQPSPQTEPSDDFYGSFGNDTDFDFDAKDSQLGEPLAATVPYDNLRREPVSVRGDNSGKLRTVIWSVVVLSLIGILVAQVTWFQLDRLSSIPELRPLYEKGCAIAGCELKPLINVDAIQSRKLVVRTDPDNRSQLVVNAVIINRADFEQPFPAIALTFSNLNGDVVAQSIFTPDEYLAGEGQELSAMPKDTPVRIAIDIRDPGKDAVNYNLNFRPYTP